MKKSNKITVIYVITSVLLFVSLLVGGVYGIYLSVGIKFMRSTVSNVTDVTEDAVSNVSYGSSANFQPSMIGVIILSALLILLSIFDLICLIKQIIFFKQFKLIRESKLEKAIENKVKSKSSVVFFAFVINILSFIVGATGIFINMHTFVDGSMSWLLYVVDGLVSILSLVSIVMLIQKLRINKKMREDTQDKYNYEENSNRDDDYKIPEHKHFDIVGERYGVKNIDSMEYVLLKLKNMKDSKVISEDEYNQLRENMAGLKINKKSKKNKQSNKTKTAE